MAGALDLLDQLVRRLLELGVGDRVIVALQYQQLLERAPRREFGRDDIGRLLRLTGVPRIDPAGEDIVDPGSEEEPSNEEHNPRANDHPAPAHHSSTDRCE